MAPLPRISVVTPSFNQGQFIAQTIDSVLDQHYPNLEHIVVDGMSTDQTPAVLARYPHLQVIREPDRGQADAINKGFRLAHGMILCFLNSDDTFLPGALHRVAREIDPARGRHVVVGRSVFTDEHGTSLGMEHDWTPVITRRRVLQAWKGNCIPQPATFWTAEAWRLCGPLEEGEQLVFDYDFMCRLSRRYRLHAIDQVLATYRIHRNSKTCSTRSQDVLERSIRVSRRYWGSPLGGLYWLLFLSRVRVPLRAHVWPAMKGWLRRLGLRDRQSPVKSPLTRVWDDFSDRHADGAVGPKFITILSVGPGHRELQLRGTVAIPGQPAPDDVRLELDGVALSCRRLDRGGEFVITAGLEGLLGGRHRLTILTRPFVIPHDYLGNGDFRPVAFRLEALTLRGGAAPVSCLPASGQAETLTTGCA